ncbi:MULTISPECIES: nucleotide exchange factor GrpE [Protofrankia]|uniref:Protein GrpE n=1 Tax=Candidatus Protofrankia datiscae TaxID=2716812 RepID=F8AUV1_9ACTN|nr:MULTISPECIES: nucleotide exchange factor GrpE [Protofrankia]AEH08146.1 Protein grpE [Candidatus Protofrankia datiscae]
MTSAPNDWTQGAPAPDEPVIVRDKRRIDPQSGQVRVEAARTQTASPAGDTVTSPAGGPPAGEAEQVASLRQQVAERTSDLQRLKAEFDNYRRRVERDRQALAEQAAGRLLLALLPTLDDIGRTRDHGDLEGPFKAVAESLEATLETAGLERFGARGDEFDPLVHDALMHTYSAEVTRPTCVDIFRAGYRHAGRVLRPAQVAVAEPAAEDPDAGQGADGTAAGAAPEAGGGSAEAAE